MIEKIFKPVKISKENFANYGDLISTNNVKPIDINMDMQRDLIIQQILTLQKIKEKQQ